MYAQNAGAALHEQVSAACPRLLGRVPQCLPDQVQQDWCIAHALSAASAFQNVNRTIVGNGLLVIVLWWCMSSLS
jgi:hypothetical protein